MSERKLYREIGNIDDSLIEEAVNARSIKTPTKKTFVWVAAATACLLVAIVVGISSLLTGDSIHINQMAAIINPDMKHEETNSREMSYDEVLHYLNIDELPTTLPGGLQMLDTDKYSILYSKDGTVYYDTFKFDYRNDDYSSQLTLSLSKKGMDYGLDFYKGAKESTIDGTKMLIGRFETQGIDDGVITYAAEFKIKGVYYTIVAENAEENDFVNAVRKILE